MAEIFDRDALRNKEIRKKLSSNKSKKNTKTLTMITHFSWDLGVVSISYEFYSATYGFKFNTPSITEAINAYNNCTF